MLKYHVKNAEKNGAKKNSYLKNAIRLWLASGMIALPWAGYATEIVRTDSGVTNVSGNIHNIYAGKELSSSVGSSTFSKFIVTPGDVANMHFRTSGGSQNFNTLLNFVDNKININGTVNAIRNGGIGGHLFFLSPEGMVVGKTGAINAGALTVLTPTTKWWDNKFDSSGNLKNDSLTVIQNNTVPINASGTIAVAGKINVTDDMLMRAGKINIGQDGSAYNAAQLTSGVTDFSQIVNVEAKSQNIYTSSGLSKGAAGLFTEGLSSILLNGMDVCIGMGENISEVNIGEGTVLYARGVDGIIQDNKNYALNVQALSIGSITIGTWAGFGNFLSKVSANTAFIPSVMVNYASMENTATVNIAGELQADLGGLR